jgi:hypothetical protein
LFLNNLLHDTEASFLETLESLIQNKVIKASKLRKFLTLEDDLNDPEAIRLDLENWYRNLGIEAIIGRKFSLSSCPFAAEEIKAAKEENNIILCVPQDVTREQLGVLFRIDSWALHDPLVAVATEKEDFWFETSMSLSPNYLKQTGVDVCHQFEDQGKLHFSLERYLVFIARVRYLLKQTPDLEYWIWLPRGRYDRSGMLIAGFDRYGGFNVHGWMPQFATSFVGARFCLPSQNGAVGK